MFSLNLGNTDCSMQIEEDLEAGDLPANDYRKMCRAYNEYCRMINELWKSGLTKRTKKSLDIMLFKAYMQRALDLDIDMKYRTRLQNVISAKHKETINGLG